MFLQNEFLIETSDAKVIEALVDAEIEGVTSHQLIARTFGAEICRFLIHCASEVPIALFSAWLYDVMKKRSADKTRIQGQRIPDNVFEITVLIQNTIQKNEADAQEAQKEMEDELPP